MSTNDPIPYLGFGISQSCTFAQPCAICDPQKATVALPPTSVESINQKLDRVIVLLERIAKSVEPRRAVRNLGPR